MTDKRTIPMGKGARSVDDFVERGGAPSERPATGTTAEAEREVTKTFRLPESLGRRLKVHAARTGQKEKDILIHLIEGYLDEHDADL